MMRLFSFISTMRSMTITFELLTIEDDDEFDKVSSAFDSLFNDEDDEEE